MSQLVQHRRELLPRFAAAYHRLRALPCRVRRHLRRHWHASLGGLALLLTLGQAPVLAVTINVDGTVCTLVDAITAANTDKLVGGCDGSASTGADTLVLEPGSTHTLTAGDNTTYAATGLPVVSSTITIVGNGSTVKRDAPPATAFRLLAVGRSGDLTVEQLTLQNGRVSGSGSGNDSLGGGVYNRGTLTLSQCVVTGNTASGFGGGVSNQGTLTLSQSTLTDNSAGSLGGGVFNFPTIGVATLTLSQGTLAGNRTSGFGGGVYNNFGTVTLTNSTLSGNVAFRSGGGVYNRGTLTMSQSTLTGNRTDYLGGGVSNLGTLSLHRSLLSSNIAGIGRELRSGGGTVTVNDYNLFGVNGDAGLFNVSPGATDVVPANGVLLNSILTSTLAFNGGPTQTLNLVSGSPALNVIPTGSCTPTDQRGFLRPSSGSTSCDIGAVEYGAAAPAPVNSSVTFVAQSATYKTSTPAPSQCPAGSVGAFSFQALLSVKAGQTTLEALKAQVKTLSGGNTLMLADVGGIDAPVLYTLMEVGQFSDGQLAAGESLLVPFVICLKTLNKFSFFVDVLGHAVAPPP